MGGAAEMTKIRIKLTNGEILVGTVPRNTLKTMADAGSRGSWLTFDWGRVITLNSAHVVYIEEVTE